MKYSTVPFSPNELTLLFETTFFRQKHLSKRLQEAIRGVRRPYIHMVTTVLSSHKYSNICKCTYNITQKELAHCSTVAYYSNSTCNFSVALLKGQEPRTARAWSVSNFHGAHWPWGKERRRFLDVTFSTVAATCSMKETRSWKELQARHWISCCFAKRFI